MSRRSVVGKRESLELPVFNTVSAPGYEHKLKTSIQQLEEKRSNLQDSVFELSSMLNALKKEIGEKKKYLSSHLTKAESELAHLIDKKRDEERALNDIERQQHQIATILVQLDQEKQKLISQEAVLQQKMQDVERQLQMVSQKDMSINQMSSTIESREKRISQKEKEAALLVELNQSKELELKKRQADLLITERNIAEQAKNIQEREARLAQIVLQVRQQQNAFLKDKNEYYKKTEHSRSSVEKILKREFEAEQLLRQVTEKEKQLKALEKKLTAQEEELQKRTFTADRVLATYDQTKTAVTDLVQRKIQLEKEVAENQRIANDLRAEKSVVEMGLLRAREELRSLESQQKIGQFSTAEMSKSMEVQRRELEKLSEELSKKEIQVREKEVLLHAQEMRLDQEKSRLINAQEIIKQREAYFVQQQEAIKKEDARLQALLFKHNHLSDKVSELELRERDMNLKILSFEKREEALQNLETNLRRREAEIVLKEEDKSVIQLQGTVAKLQDQIKDAQKVNLDLNSKVQEIELDRKSIAEALKKYDELHQALHAEISALKNENAQLKADTETSQTDEEALKKENEELRKNLFDVEQQKVHFVDKDEDTRAVLELTDKLLEHLPDDVLQEFVKSENFKLFEKVFKKYNIG